MYTSSVRVLMFHPDKFFIPRSESEGASGLDVRAWLPEVLNMRASETHVVPTGLHVAVPRGYEIQVRSRSGHAARGSFFVLNSPGTIDSDYRGEVSIIIHALRDFSIYNGDRIAQLVVCPVIVSPVLKIDRVDSIDDLGSTERGSGGFGSTGSALQF